MQMIYILISLVTLTNHLSFQMVMLISLKEPTENIFSNPHKSSFFSKSHAY